MRREAILEVRGNTQSAAAQNESIDALLEVFGAPPRAAATRQLSGNRRQVGDHIDGRVDIANASS